MRVGRQGSGIHARLAEEHAGQLATAANSIDRVAKNPADDDACLFAQLQVTWIGFTSHVRRHVCKAWQDVR